MPRSVECSRIRFLLSRPGLWINGVQQGRVGPLLGARMAAELVEYRPWKTWAQFDKEIGKYVGQQETDRLKQYVFIPPG